MIPTLSIAIPTYNFGAFIGETLDSIIAQLEPGVDILVLDGGSSDDTASVVAERQVGCPALRYHRQNRRGGIDRDLDRSVALTGGDYVWLLSADDIARPDAIARIRNKTRLGFDVLIGTHSVCDLAMRELVPVYPVLAIGVDEDFELRSEEARERYAALARTSEAFFSFMSGIVIRKAYWNTVPFQDRYAGSCWAHAARLLILMRRGMSLAFLARPIVERRGDNDSFLTDGMVRRAALAIEGYTRIISDIFGDPSPQLTAVRRALRYEYPPRHMHFVKRMAARTGEDLGHLRRLIGMLYAEPTVPNRLRTAAFDLLPGASYGAIWHNLDRLRRLRTRAFGRN